MIPQRLSIGFLCTVVTACMEMAAGQGHANAEAAMQWQGILSRVAEETTVVATTQAEWEALWARVTKPPPSALPDDTIAVGIFLGQRRTAGYGVEIVAAAPSGAGFTVVYAERKPAGPVLMMITFPYLIRLFPDPGLPVRVEKRS